MVQCPVVVERRTCAGWEAFPWFLLSLVPCLLTKTRSWLAGAQIPLEDVPSVQKEVVVRCRQAGKPVIVASHLLQSMIEYPTPTRAEVLPAFPLSRYCYKFVQFYTDEIDQIISNDHGGNWQSPQTTTSC